MVVKNPLGLIVSVVGVVILASGVKGLNGFFVKLFPILARINPIYLMGVGLIVAIVGIALIRGNNSGKKLDEVPIYKGKQIVGYRRH